MEVEKKVESRTKRIGNLARPLQPPIDKACLERRSEQSDDEDNDTKEQGHQEDDTEEQGHQEDDLEKQGHQEDGLEKQGHQEENLGNPASKRVDDKETSFEVSKGVQQSSQSV